MTRIKHIFRQDAPCLQYAALGDTAVRIITIHHWIETRDLDALIVPQNNPKLVPLWRAVFGEERIILNPADIPANFRDARVSMPTGLDWGFGSAGWNVFESVMWESAFFDTRGMKIVPPVTFPCDPKSKAVMIYPVEHTDGNQVYNTQWWIDTCRKFQKKDYHINVLGERSHPQLLELCEEIEAVKHFDPTIEDLCRCAAESSIAIGGSTGPTWTLLLSDIPQIVLESKRAPHGYWHFDRCQSVLSKKLKILPTLEAWLRDI